jgi:hypothetical protein
MTATAVKLVLTPLLIGAVTLAARRWGPSVGGWLAGFPLTSGPVSVFLALEQGRPFAERAAGGTLLGLLSMAVFCLVYSRMAFRAAWLPSAATGLAAFVLCTLLLKGVTLPAVVEFGLVCLVLGLIARAMPVVRAPVRPIASPPWDLPLRMGVATGVVVGLTSLAAFLGPALSGLLSPIPVFALVLAVFAHRAQGPGPAAQFLRAVVIGSFAFAAFFVVVGTTLTRAGIGATYLMATICALAVNGGVLYLGRRLL